MKKTFILFFSILFILTSAFPVKASEIKPINHLVGKLYGQLLLLELFHIVDHPQAVQNHLYLLHVLL